MTTPDGEPPRSEPVPPPTTLSGSPAGVAGLPRRARVGRWLDTLGMLGAPFFMGAVAGFWVADAGVRWLPTMLAVVSTGCAASLLLFLAGKMLRGRAHLLTREGLKVRRRVVAAFSLVLVACGVRLLVYFSQQPSPLTLLAEPALETAFRIDSERVRELDLGLERVAREIEALLPEGADARAVLSAEQEEALRTGWRAVFEQCYELDRIREFYEDWYRFDPSRARRADHLRAFLLSFTSELSAYEKGTRVASAVLRNENARRLLDAPSGEWHLPADSFSRFRQEMQGSRDQARIVASASYMSVLGGALGARDEAERLGVGWLWETARVETASLERMGRLQRAAFSARGDLQLLKRSVRRAWFPAQKGVAEAMGDTRVRRVGWYLITPDQQAQLDAAMKPGDIMLARKNWYLSNVGLPGFWPHAILYIGSPDELRSTFDDPDVRAWVRGASGRDQGLDEWLAERFPREWAAYVAGDDGQPRTVIEAISEGVVLNSLPHVAGDYAAALRPNLSLTAKAQAVVAAFESLGKPYDYDFDFATDHALVCTELAWRAYRPRTGKDGLDIPLTRVAGRMTLPANDIVKYFDETADGAAPPLAFVAFVDASEKERRAFVSDEAAFRASWRRPKWGEVR